MPQDGSDQHYYVDASTFQKPLGELAEVLAQKVLREGPGALAAPGYVAIDMHVLVRQAKYTYNFLYYINADERRETDCYWRDVYTIIAAPLVRSMIDCLYNVTLILQSPGVNGPAFRKSGFKKTFQDLDEEERLYGSRPEWDAYIKEGRAKTDFKMRESNLTMAEVMAGRSWPTLGRYLRDVPKGALPTPHQEFLRTLTYGAWREYSALSHGAFEGLLLVGMYYTWDSQPHEDRPKIDEFLPQIMSMHLARAAAILLCIITELQAYFRFEGANINERINKVWSSLLAIPEVKELFNERYAQLMKDKGITT